MWKTYKKKSYKNIFLEDIIVKKNLIKSDDELCLLHTVCTVRSNAIFTVDFSRNDTNV